MAATAFTANVRIIHSDTGKCTSLRNPRRLFVRDSCSLQTTLSEPPSRIASISEFYVSERSLNVSSSRIAAFAHKACLWELKDAPKVRHALSLQCVSFTDCIIVGTWWKRLQETNSYRLTKLTRRLGLGTDSLPCARRSP